MLHRARTAIFAIAVPAALLACAQPTSILVEVTSDLAVPAEVDELSVTVTGSNSGAVVERTFALTEGWPQTVSVRPGDVESAGVVIEAVALLDGTAVATRRVESAFVDGTQVDVLIDLSRGLNDGGMDDAAVPEDAAPPMDSGPPTDGGPLPDAGPPPDGGPIPDGAASYTVGGTVSGLEGTGLALASGSQFLPISADGAFEFGSPLADGASYTVTVLTQPTSPSQTCAIDNGSGTIAGADVTDVTVECTTSRFTVGGTVSGLTGSGLVLRNAGGDDLAISGNGAFTFPTAVASGDGYAVTVATPPSGPTQTCSVSMATGTVGASNVTNVAVTCSVNAYTVGGTVTGLNGTGLVLQNNGGDDLAVSANGTFTFPTAVASGAGYAVTVATQPSSPPQRCVVGSGTGTVGSADVTSVAVTCTNTHAIGGTVSGLSGSGLVLRNNGGDPLTITGNGSFSFPTRLPVGSAYSVTVQTQPTLPTQTCAVSSGSGTVGTSDVTSVSVTCTTNTYTVGGTVTGLAGSGLVLRNNGGDDLAVSSDGSFTFSTAVPSGGIYNVTVQAQPTSPWQTCALTSGTSSGGVVSSNITSVRVTCTTNTYRVGGTLIQMSGSGLVLLNSGGDPLTLSSNGSFFFSTRVASGQPYAVTIQTQPTSPAQICVVTSGTASGVVTNADITDVQVRCGDRRIFVTSTAYDGNLGGLTGADAICQSHADAAGLGGTYMAWLSDSTGSPATRMTHSSTAYVRVDGALIANSWADLTDGSIANPINLNELGGPPPASSGMCSGDTVFVWTNTTPSGTLHDVAYGCSDWSSTSGTARWGRHPLTTTQWTQACSGGTCAWVAPLYCVEQ